MDQVRVVLDCDTANEVDDQFAIAHTLGLPEGTLDVRGVISVHNTTAHGPGSRDMYQEEAERVVALCAGGVPCIPGAERPMESREEPVPSAGLEVLVEEARLGPLTIVATGPATDVASLFLAAPESRENVRVVWLGGFGEEASYKVWHNRMGELNGRADISAWRVLLEEPVDLLHVPTWPAPAKILVDPSSFAEELRALERPVASYLAEILQPFAAEYEDRPGKELWDLACVAAVADPGALTSGPVAVPTLGAAGAHDFTQPVRTVEVVSDLDERRVLAGLTEALTRHPS
ncbi:MAG TPA: nucleoside hydrolase [Rubrobacter sp.]|nr:nucleoside hydrolase [Rubrobacter sp.]